MCLDTKVGTFFPGAKGGDAKEIMAPCGVFVVNRIIVAVSWYRKKNQRRCTNDEEVFIIVFVASVC